MTTTKKVQADAGAPGLPERGARPTRLQTVPGNVSGAFADLGTFLPLVLGVLLVVAGGELALSRRLFDAGPDALAVIVLTGVIAVAVNIAVGFLAGMLAEILRRHWTGERTGQ